MSPAAEKSLWALGLLAVGGAVVSGVAWATSGGSNTQKSPAIPPTRSPPITIGPITPLAPTTVQGNQTVNLDVNVNSVVLRMMAGSDLTFAAPSGGAVTQVNGIGLLGNQTFTIPGSELAKGTYTYTVTWIPTSGNMQFSYTTTVKVTVI